MLGNKTVQYSVSADLWGKMQKVMDTTSVQLPSWEKLTDTIKGAGIMGELNMPSPFGLSAATVTISGRVDGKVYAELAAPGRKKLEIRWITDAFDQATGNTKTVRHRVVILGYTTKRDPGKLEGNSGADISLELSVSYYKNEIDGYVVEEIDILNNKYIVNGHDYAAEVRSFLG